MTASARPYAEVIGDPIDHSLSPEIHNFWLEKLGIAADYRRRRVERVGLADYIADRRADRHWRGSNVTMPLKLDAITLADERSDLALGTGAANILLPRENKLYAGNTDVAAVRKTVEKLIERGAPAAIVTLLGSGGAARAALMALHLLGIDSVRIQSRNKAEAYSLAVQFRLSEEPRPFDSPVTGDGLINATPCGMAGAPPLTVDFGRLAENGWVIDFVTSAAATDLIRRATARNLTTVGGIALLVEQAADSFALLFGADPPRDSDGELLARLAS